MKTYLLDTQVALWILLGSKRLSEKKFRKRFLSEPSQMVFHQVSTWEIQIKYQLEKLDLPKEPNDFLMSAIKSSGFSYKRIEDKGIFMLGRLPKVHRDPFDRLLISHALINGWSVITADSKFKKYPISVEEV